MMPFPRLVIAILVTVASAAGFVWWLQTRTPTPPTESPSNAAPGAGVDETERVRRELELLQDKLAAAIKNKRNPAEVLAEARRFADRHANLPEAHVTLAQVLSVSGLTDEAYTHFLRALELNPQQPEVHDLAGSLAMGRKRYTEAQRHYREAASLDKRNAKYRLHLAIAQLRENRYEEARGSLLEVIQLDSTSHAAYSVMSDLHAEQNKLPQALDAINRALELVLDNEEYRLVYLRKKATLLRRGNRADEALVILRQVPAKRWVEADVIDEFAQTYMLLGQPEKAAEHYEAVLPLDPMADWAAERAAHYRLKAGQKDAARAALDTLRRINPRAPMIPDLEKALRE